MYIFTSLPLDGSYDANLDKVFPMQTLPLAKFLKCSPTFYPTPPAVAHLVFVAVAILSVFCLLGVSIFALCQRSSLTGEQVQGNRNIRFKYRSIRGGGGRDSLSSFSWSGRGGVAAGLTGGRGRASPTINSESATLTKKAKKKETKAKATANMVKGGQRQSPANRRQQ